MIQRIECKDIRRYIIKECLEARQFSSKINPRLAILAVDPTPDDRIYMDSIRKLCDMMDVGMTFSVIDSSENEEILRKSYESFIDMQRELNCPILVIGNDDGKFDFKIPSSLDIDCTTHGSRGVFLSGKDIYFSPITAKAVEKVINRIYDTDIYFSMHAVIFGRGRIGQDIAALLRRMNMVVTTLNSHTVKADQLHICRDANVIITATGHPNTLTPQDLKYIIECGRHDKLFIDVGITDTEDGIVGDITWPKCPKEFFNTENKAIYYTTAKGGIGSITTAMLLHEVFIHSIYEHISNSK